MVSAGISALLKKMDYKDVVVAIDGSVFRFHPHFPNIMKSRIAQLMGIDYKFDLMLSTDGSGRGAALVAAVSQNPDYPQFYRGVTPLVRANAFWPTYVAG